MNHPEQRLARALAVCARAQIRMTPLRRAILHFLARERMPVTLAAVARADGVHGRCSLTTVYRTLMLLQEAEVLRQVGTTHKASSFVLNEPGETRLFVICRHCGTRSPLAASDTLRATLASAASAHGFLASPLDAELHGVCLQCHRARQKRVAASKLIFRPGT